MFSLADILYAALCASDAIDNIMTFAGDIGHDSMCCTSGIDFDFATGIEFWAVSARCVFANIGCM